MPVCFRRKTKMGGYVGVEAGRTIRGGRKAGKGEVTVAGMLLGTCCASPYS